MISLKSLLAERRAILVPGAANALFARVIEELEFECVYVTGAGIANMALGAPDIGLTSLDEVASTVARIADAVSLPLIVDADTGFGNAVNAIIPCGCSSAPALRQSRSRTRTFPSAAVISAASRSFPRPRWWPRSAPRSMRGIVLTR